MTGDEDAKLVLRDDVVWRDGDGAVILLDTRASLYLSIGGTGPLLWPLLVGGTTATALAALLMETFSIDEALAERDVSAFVARLRDLDLLDG